MAALNDCIFLYLGKDGICPNNIGRKKCYKKCGKYARVTDQDTDIYKDWQKEIENMRIKLQKKYFPETNDDIQKELDDLLG